MIGWIVVGIAIVFAVIVFVKYKQKLVLRNQQNNGNNAVLAQTGRRIVNVSMSSRFETGDRIYFADNRQNLD